MLGSGLRIDVRIDTWVRSPYLPDSPKTRHCHSVDKVHTGVKVRFSMVSLPSRGLLVKGNPTLWGYKGRKIYGNFGVPHSHYQVTMWLSRWMVESVFDPGSGVRRDRLPRTTEPFIHDSIDTVPRNSHRSSGRFQTFSDSPCRVGVGTPLGGVDPVKILPTKVLLRSD